MTTENIEIQEQVITETKKPIKTNRIIKYIIVIALIIAAGYTYYMFTPEQKAKRVVEGYLYAMQNGENTYPYKEIDVDDFINLIKYEYINTALAEEKPEIITMTKKSYEKSFTDYHDSFDDFKKFIKEGKDKSDIIKDTKDTLIYKSGDIFHEFTFLYSIENSNAGGQKLYQRYYFMVNNDNYDNKYKVIDFFKVN